MKPMWNHSISLPLKKQVIEDADGFPTETTYEYMGGIPANFTDTTRDDELLANQLGYSADRNVEIMACNYSGQSFLVDEATGEKYDVKRTFQKNKAGTVNLTVQRREKGAAV